MPASKSKLRFGITFPSPSVPLGARHLSTAAPTSREDGRQSPFLDPAGPTASHPKPREFRRQLSTPSRLARSGSSWKIGRCRWSCHPESLAPEKASARTLSPAAGAPPEGPQGFLEALVDPFRDRQSLPLRRDLGAPFSPRQRDPDRCFSRCGSLQPHFGRRSIPRMRPSARNAIPPQTETMVATSNVASYFVLLNFSHTNFPSSARDSRDRV
jgi:hypothetical protein